MIELMQSKPIRSQLLSTPHRKYICITVWKIVRLTKYHPLKCIYILHTIYIQSFCIYYLYLFIDWPQWQVTYIPFIALFTVLTISNYFVLSQNKFEINPYFITLIFFQLNFKNWEWMKRNVLRTESHVETIIIWKDTFMIRRRVYLTLGWSLLSFTNFWQHQIHESERGNLLQQYWRTITAQLKIFIDCRDLLHRSWVCWKF